MTPNEFRALLNGEGEAHLLGLCLLDEATPYVFERDPNAWGAFRDELVGRLGVQRSDIRVVGSGRLGFSMRPGHNLRAFEDTSDIDVVVVSSALFDQLWIHLLEAVYPRLFEGSRLGGWLEARRRELYKGWLTPLKIRLDAKIVGAKAKPVLDFKVRWFNALKQASRYPPRRHEDVAGRLYRTWRHAELYHLDSLSALRKNLAE